MSILTMFYSPQFGAVICQRRDHDWVDTEPLPGLQLDRHYSPQFWGPDSACSYSTVTGSTLPLSASRNMSASGAGPVRSM